MADSTPSLIDSRSNPNLFPCDPPHKSLEQYVQQRGNTSGSWWNPFDYFQRKKLEQEWKNGGHVTSWHSKITVSNESPQTDDSQRKTKLTDVCFTNRALVRGDGKILSTVDRYKTDCSLCSYFAENVNGYLKGIDAVGMYEYPSKETNQSVNTSSV